MATVKEVTRVTNYNLELSRKEARTLVWILRRVGGSPDHTPRREAASVLDALVNAGVNEVEWSDDGIHRSLIFADKK